MMGCVSGQGLKRQITEIAWQRVPGCRACNGKVPDTGPVTTAVTMGVVFWRPSWRPSKRLPKYIARRDGSFVRGLNRRNWWRGIIIIVCYAEAAVQYTQ